MKITLCGSTKFKDAYLDINKRLTLAGHVVYTVAWFAHKEIVPPTPEEKVRLDLVHLHKISASDAIVVIDLPHGDDPAYIGESTRKEMQWAEMTGKEAYSVSGLNGPSLESLLPPEAVPSHPMITNYYRDIGEFHRKFGLPPVAEHPSLLPEVMEQFRYRFMYEELSEYREAVSAGNLAEAADALVDLVYVALGTAYLMGLPFNELWSEVHRANMSKVRTQRPEDSKRGSTFDVIKPKGWRPPQIEEILSEHGALFKTLDPTI